MRILYVGPLWPGGTCRQQMVALQELGHEVTGVDTTPPAPAREEWLPIRALRRLGCWVDWARANAQILRWLETVRFDVLWVVKGLTISPQTLLAVKKYCPACRAVSYSPDDMMNPRNQSRCYLASVSLYDLHVTTKSYNIGELKELGARDVLFVGKGFDPHTHRPLALSTEERQRWGADVGFVGNFERPRYATMCFLVQSGLPVVVRGPGWERCEGKHTNLMVKAGWVLGDDYARAICATKVNLGFLCKANRDLQTTRSIEIPACGGFMLAERTGEHQALFKEGDEAEFFGDEHELFDKARYYLRHEEQRARIALGGRQRCLRAGYSNHDRLKGVLSYLAGKPTAARVGREVADSHGAQEGLA